MKVLVLAFSLFSLVSLAAPLYAQSVSFVRNLPLAKHSPIIPLRTNSAVTPYLYLVASNQLWRMAPGETSFELIDDGMAGVKGNQFTKPMLDNADPSAQVLAFYGLNRSIYKFSLNDIAFTESLPPYYDQREEVYHLVPNGPGHGVLLVGSPVATTGNRIFDVNLQTGALNLLFTDLNALNIQPDSDGGIWVLRRQGSLEKFTLTSGTWTSTASFSISGPFDGTLALAPTGELVLGDGLGGGSVYSPTGTPLATFSPPSTVTFDPLATGYGTSYINIDANGMMTVYANTRPRLPDGRGMYNIYQFTAVPEPSAYAAGVVALLAGAIALRRRQRAS